MEISFRRRAMELLPDHGHYDMCLSCGLCSSGCPASGLADMDPRKFLRMATLGMDDEVRATDWVWMCTMCNRCRHVCPMNIDIPHLVWLARASWPRETRPRGIVASCDASLKSGTHSAMGASPEDFAFVVGDVLEEVRDTQAGFEALDAPLNRRGPSSS